MKTPRSSLRPSILAASAAALLLSLTATAQDIFTWTGGTDGSWNSLGNWTGPAPVPDGNDILNFAGTTNLITTNNLVGPALNQHRIFFNAGAGDFTLGGTALTLFDFGTNAPKIENNSSLSTQTISLAVTLDSAAAAGNLAEINPVDGNLIFGSTVSLVDVNELRIFGNNGNTVTFNGAISGTGSKLAVKQNSIVVLNAANTFTGNVEIDAGEVRLGAGGSLNAGSTVFLGNGGSTATAAILSLGSATGGQTLGNAITVNPGDGFNRTISSQNTSGTNTITGNIALGGVLGENRTVTFDTAAGGTLSVTTGVISGSGQGVTKTGDGILVLGGTNTYTGGTTVNAGTLSVAADANLGGAVGGLTLDGGTLNMSAAFTTARVITLGNTFGSGVTTPTGASVWSGYVTGSGGFTKSGAGSLQLSGATGNDFFGTANVNQGTLFLNKTSGNAIGAGGAIITSNNTAGFGAANVSLSANEQIENTAPVTLSANGGVRAGFDLNNFTETVGAVTLTSVTNGSATIALGATGKLILTQDLIFNANRNATGNTGREVLITGTGTYATAGAGGTLDLGGGLRTITVNTNNAQLNSDATVEAVIANGTLVKNGARVLRLGAVNTYSALTVNEGTVRALVNGAIPAGIPLTISGTNFGSNATVDFNGFNYTLTAANSLVFGGGSGGATIATGTGTLTLNTPLTVDLTNDPQTLTVSGNLNLNGVQDTFNIGDSGNATTELLISAVISGSATGLTKTGAGTLALSGANTFTGPINVNGGAVAVRAANTVTGNVILNGGALQFDTALADNAAFNTIMGAAANGIVVGASGGSILVNFAAQADRTLTGRSIAVNGPLTIDVTRSEAIGANQLRLAQGTLPSVLTGTGTITKNGDGRFTVASPATTSANFSGAWIINAGTVEAAGVSLGDGSATNSVTVNGLSGGATQLGNLGVSGPTTQNITLNGGAVSSNGTGRIMSGTLNVATDSFIFLSDFWRDNGAANLLTQTGPVTGNGALTISVNRVGYDANSGSFILQNPASSYSGAITVEKNLNLENTPTSGVGRTIGSGAVTLAGGHLRLKDNGAGSNGTLAYGNNVIVVDPAGGGDLAGIAAITADRVNGTNLNNTFQFGTLSIGAQQLDVTGTNGYKVAFSGLTTFTGSPTFNVTSSVLTLAGGVSGAGQTFTKTGAGTLRILGAVDYAGYTLTGGTLEVPTAPPGAARDIIIPLGIGFSAGYAATQANLIDRVTFDSAGVVALGVDSTFNPDFTGFLASLRLGGTANATLTGTITSADGTVRLGGGGGTLILASTNAVTGPVSLDVNVNGTAPGTVVLADANNFVGTLTVGGGMTLRAGINASLGSGLSAMTLDNGVLQTGFSGTLTRTITAGAGGATVDTDGNTVTHASPIGGTGPFTKAGAGTLILTSASTFAGATTVSGGALNIQNATALGATTAGTTVAAGAALELQGGIAVGAEALTLNGTLRNVAGDNTYGGAITINAGSTFDVAAATALTVSAATPNTGTGAWTKTGNGTLRITADPGNTGLLTISNGVVELNHGGTTEFPMTIQSGATLRTLTASLGDTTSDMTVNAGGTFDFQSGNDTMGGLSGAGLVTRQVASAATLTLNNGAETTTFSGVIENGLGTVGITKASTGTLTLAGTNTFTGTTLVNNATLAINGAAGALAGSTAVNVGDGNGGAEAMNFGLADDVWAGGTLNRINDAANLTINGATTGGLSYTGPANGSAVTNVETIGTLTFSGGRNNVTLAPGTGNEVQITTGTIARTNNGTGVIRGTNLNGTGAGSTRLVVTTTSGLLSGAGGADGTTNKSIIRYVLGDTSVTGAGTDFVTLDGANGARLLAPSEYSATIAGSFVLRNVSVAGGETVTSSVPINSLRATGGTTTINAGATVRVDSGAILFTNDATIAGGGTIDFGANDGIIHVAKNTTAATGTLNVARLTGAGGLTYGRSGDVVNIFELGGDNSVIGTFFNNQGTVRLLSSGALNDSIPMTYIPRPGTALQINGNNVTVRDLQAGGGTGTFQNGAATAATLTTYLTAARSLSVGTPLQNGGTGALNLVVSGGQTLSSDQDSSATGSFEVRTGALALTGTTGTINDFTSVLVSGAGTLRMTNASGSANTNRVGTVPISLIAATIDFDNNASAASFSETLGALTLGAGSNFISVDKAASGQTSVLTIDSLAARNPGALLIANSQNNGTAIFDLGQTTQSRLVFTPGFTLDDGMIGGWAVVQTSATAREFAKYVGTGTISLTQLVTADYTVALATGANPTQNVRLTATPAALTGNTQINSLTLNQASATTVDIGVGFTLRLESGGLAVNNNFNANFINGTLTAGTGANTAGELFIHAISAAANPVVIDSVIADNGTGVLTLTKGGAGVLDLQGVTNTYTGRTFLSGGTLRINADANLGSAPLAPSVGHLTTSTNAILEVTENMTLHANRGIALGGGTTVISITPGTTLGTGKTLTYNGSFTTVPGVNEAGLTFQSNASATNIDTGEINATLSAPLNIGGTLRIEAGTVTASAGDNVVGRSFQVGVNGVATYTQSSGSLRIGAGITDTFDIGVSGSDTINKTGILNLAGVTNLTANVDLVRIGVVTGGASVPLGTATFATSNDITAGTSFIVGDSGNPGLGTQAMTFGSGTHNITTQLLTWGGRKAVTTLTLGAGGIMNLQGFGQRTLDMFVGRQNVDTSGVNLSTFNASTGTVIGSFDALTVGLKSAAGTLVGGSDASFTLGTSAANLIEANTLDLGNRSQFTGTASALSRAIGTLSMGGGSLTVFNDVSMGTLLDNGTAKGVLNLTGGTFTVGGNFTKTDNARSSSLVNVAGATLDLQNQAAGDTTPGTITASQLAFRSGSIVDTASATLDGRGVTDGVAIAPLDDALIVRDVALSFAVSLTNTTADKGGIHYEAAGSGAGATLSGPLNLGGVARIVNVENSAGAASDLTLTGAITGAPAVTKTGAGTLAINAALGTGTTTLNANVGTTTLGVSQTLAALNIGAGATVILTDAAPAPALAGGGDILAAVAGLGEPAGIDAIGAASSFGDAAQVAAVPEPGTFGLLALGALGMLARRRRARA